MFRSLSILCALGLTTGAFSLSCAEGGLPSTGLADDGPAEQTPDGPALIPQESGTTNRFFSVSPVNPDIVWASADGGTFVVTTDGGDTWRAATVPGAEELQFRDVAGVNARIAYLLSAGEGPANRIYKTEDGGATWTLQFQAGDDPRNFYDCFDFWTSRRGITFADNIDGRFPVIKTIDGDTWQDIGDRLPPAQPREAGFAASGTCVATHDDRRAWIGTGGAAQARVLATTDAGFTWEAFTVPIRQGTSTSGVVTIAFRDRFSGMLGGGDVVANAEAQDNVARSSDGGRSWQLATPTPFPGAVYGLAYVPGHQKTTVVATGPGGAAWSPDEGATWTLLPGVQNFWAVAFASRKAGWLVGAEGRILKLDFSRPDGTLEGDP